MESAYRTSTTLTPRSLLRLFPDVVISPVHFISILRTPYSPRLVEFPFSFCTSIPFSVSASPFSDT